MTANAKTTLFRVALAAATLGVIGGWAVAAGPAALTVFQAGQPIRASELNSNFHFLKALADQGSERVGSLADSMVLPQRLRKLSPTQVAWPAGSKVVLDGGLIVTTQDLTVATTLTGVGGIQGGTTVDHKLYSVHAVLTAGGQVGLIATEDGSLPEGFPSTKQLGRFMTGANGTVLAAYGEHARGPLARIRRESLLTDEDGDMKEVELLVLTPGVWHVRCGFYLAQTEESFTEGKNVFVRSVAFGIFSADLDVPFVSFNSHDSPLSGYEGTCGPELVVVPRQDVVEVKMLTFSPTYPGPNGEKQKVTTRHFIEAVKFDDADSTSLPEPAPIEPSDGDYDPLPQ